MSSFKHNKITSLISQNFIAILFLHEPVVMLIFIFPSEF